jgi:hypothetical protein
MVYLNFDHKWDGTSLYHVDVENNNLIPKIVMAITFMA